MSKSKSKKKINPFKVKKSQARPQHASQKRGSFMPANHHRTTTIAMLCSRARILQSELTRVKPMYEELDAIVEELLKVQSELPPGVALVDTYADKNKRWKSVCMTRFELAFGEGDSDE